MCVDLSSLFSSAHSRVLRFRFVSGSSAVGNVGDVSGGYKGGLRAGMPEGVFDSVSLERAGVN